jgi:hypothetical protein
MDAGCCQVEVFATDRSLVQRSPIDCVCVTEYDQVQQQTCTSTVIRQKK